MPISPKDLALALIESIEDNPKKSKELINNFIKFCSKKGMAHKLPNVLKYIEFKNKEEQEREMFKLTSSEKLKEKAIKEIIKMTIGSLPKTGIEEKIDKNLIAGFIVEHKGVVYDASMRGQLRKIKNKLNS
jgi:ATP synthase F1 delta subunit